jgi:hypothetical protein
VTARTMGKSNWSRWPDRGQPLTSWAEQVEAWAIVEGRRAS